MSGVEHDVVVVGAGLAGLRCARELTRSGFATVVLEASDRIGGRQSTDEVDGFLVDRGFQVINPAYPALTRAVDLGALGLQSFGAGVVVRNDQRLVTLAHPLREPTRIPDLLRGGYLTPRSMAALLRWLGPVLVSPRRVVDGPDQTLAQALDQAGLDGGMRRVLETFVSGVLVDASAGSSDAFTRLLVRMFALGVPGLPARGVQALPRMLAQELTDIRVEHPVERVERVGDHYVVHGGGEELTARQVVVAVSPEAVGGLTSLASPPMHGLVTWWFAAAEPPTASTMLHVDDRSTTRPGHGVVNTAVVSNAVPSYSPDARALVQATVLLEASGGTMSEDRVREQVSAIYGCSTAGWEVVERHEIRHALPAQPAPLRPARGQVDLDGIVVCGDHRDTASIQGALVSGERAASRVGLTLGAAVG